MAMLLDDDGDKALRELSRIADYRNYRQYEIYKEVEGKPPIALSEYGTGSGGQLETPAYIIRAAAITSAFRFSEGNSHLRTVLVDEAFSKYADFLFFRGRGRDAGSLWIQSFGTGRPSTSSDLPESGEREVKSWEPTTHRDQKICRSTPASKLQRITLRA